MRPNLAAALPHPTDHTVAFPVPAQLIDVLPDPREGVTGRVLHLMDVTGAHILHVVDDLGRLHRTDGPALVKVTPGSSASSSGRFASSADAPVLRPGRFASSAWWVDGHPIDDAPGTLTRVVRLGTFATLDDAEIGALNAHLPHRHHVAADGVIYAPSSVWNILTEEDLIQAWAYSDTLDPVVSLALSL